MKCNSVQYAIQMYAMKQYIFAQSIQCAINKDKYVQNPKKDVQYTKKNSTQYNCAIKRTILKYNNILCNTEQHIAAKILCKTLCNVGNIRVSCRCWQDGGTVTVTVTDGDVSAQRRVTVTSRSQLP